jgi:hypothetical protein
VRILYEPDGSSAFSADENTDALASRPIDLMDRYYHEAVAAGFEPSERWLVSQ